jgi:hypothetical protein
MVTWRYQHDDDFYIIHVIEGEFLTATQLSQPASQVSLTTALAAAFRMPCLRYRYKTASMHHSQPQQILITLHMPSRVFPNFSTPVRSRVALLS